MTQNKIFAARTGSRRLIRGGVLTAIFCFVIWLTGLLWFATLLPTSIADATRASDAIVVLTGGRGRIHEGLELLAQKRAKKLWKSVV